MKTSKLRLFTSNDQSEHRLGPPLPRSIFLWRVWGGSCYDESHGDRCIALTSGHVQIEEVYAEHTAYCTGAPKCEYWVHWLMGEHERPGDLETDREWGMYH